MDELKFVIRCFGFAALFLVLTQIKAGDMTIESHIHSSLVSTNVVHFVNSVAAGGVKLMKDGVHFTKDYYQEWKHSESSKKTPAVKQAKIEPSSDEETEQYEIQ